MDIMSKFNLPTYVKGKSFSEASAIIAKRFEDRNSPEDVATLNELQGRLQQAQEFVKSEQEARTKRQHQMPDGSMMDGASHQEGASAEAQAPGLNEGVVPSGAEAPANAFFMGGLTDATNGLDPNAIPGTEAATSGAEGIAGGAMAAMGALKGASALASQLTAHKNIDTSGASAAPETPSVGGSAASGAMSGAQIGGAIVPGLGHAIGAVGGGIMGLIGGKSQQKAADEARTNFSFGEQNKATNSYFTGGQQDQLGDDVDFDGRRTGAPYANAPKATSLLDMLGMNDKSIGIDPNMSNEYTPSLDLPEASAPKTTTEESVFNPTELLRYAPAAMNLGQLAGLKKPEGIALDKLTDRYNPQRVDERGLQNAAQNAANINKDAILSSSGGSGSSARAALLGSERNASRNLSDAYQSATGENRQDNRKGQEFNANINKTNLNQSNQETNLNLEQQAAYQTNKSKLLSQIGNDLGGVGKEELLKRYPELMGMNYNWKGKHKSKTQKKK